MGYVLVALSMIALLVVSCIYLPWLVSLGIVLIFLSFGFLGFSLLVIAACIYLPWFVSVPIVLIFLGALISSDD